jgi:hypothetical protein
MVGSDVLKAETMPVTSGATEPAMKPGDMELTSSDGLAVWTGRKVIDDREWSTSVSLNPTATDKDAFAAIEREFARGHRWLTHGVADVKPLPTKVKMLVNVFTYAKQIGADAFSYCCGVGPALKNHERADDISVSYTHGYPTDKMRNAVVKEARAHGHDFVLMIDDDQVPDIGIRDYPERSDMVPFLPSALDVALAHDGPCLVGAPYCSTPPLQQVLVMKNREYVPGLLDGMGLKIDKYTRDEAALMTGIQRVAALPTGMLLVDLRALDVLPPPWFSYEFDDAPFNTSLASTEDIVFTRNLDWLGVKQYCHWSAWAGHAKHYTTGIPTAAPVVDIPKSIYRAWSSNGWRPKNQRA